jgi:hypothetical protein
MNPTPDADRLLAAIGPDIGYGPPEDEQEPPPRRTWKPVDLGPVLDGTWEPPEPSVGSRDDGHGLFYPGRMHVVAAEAEAGKTWLALAAAATELARGESCVYLDFEDDEGGIAGRLLTIGADREAIRKRFAYIRPESPVRGVGEHDLADALGDLKPSLVIIDGVTEAMSLHGLELKDNTDVARFGQLLPRRMTAAGAATVLLDHVVKDREARGGYAIGGVHKLNGLNGAMYLLENRDPFGIGRTGRSRLLIRKDRPGRLRRHAVQAHDSLFWYADLTVRSHGEDFAEAALPPPEQHNDTPFRPTAIMTRISAVLAEVTGGLSGNAVEGAVKGKRETIRYALELLVSEGFVQVDRRGQTKIHKLVKPFADYGANPV